MEHITVSELSSDAAPTIPYVGSKAWDGLPFLTFMEREGWDEAQLIGQQDKRKRTETEILDFLQTWLFFGLLAESCGEKGQRAYFVNALPGGEYVICTTNLRAVYRQEKKRRAEGSKEDYELWYSHLVECLNVAHSVLAKLAIEKVPYLSSPVILGIANLCDFVKKTMLIDEGRQQCSFLTPEATVFIQNAMLKQGWCRTDVQRLSSNLDIASLFLVASQPRPDPDKDHSNCDNQKCGAYQVDERFYLRLHDLSCDRTNCRDLQAEPTSLHAILSSGSIPLTRYNEKVTGEPELQVIRADLGTKYVAISHVWSDGFGNPKENRLFACQARRIARYVSSLMASNSTDIPFWIDTLSCPVTPLEATDLAISMMRETYADAEKVLVLNSHMLNRKKPLLCLEILALVISSSWTRRLWTLQEGVLAKEVVIQFEDESIDFSTAIALAHLELQQFLEPESFEYNTLLNMATRLHDLWEAKEQSVSERLLTCLHSELQWRSTSVATDEPLCISALLGLSLRDIMKANVADRTKQLWTLIQDPPKIVLFWSGERLKEPGFRWAPATLLGAPKSYFLKGLLPTTRTPTALGSQEQARLSKDGLIFRSDGLRLRDWTTVISKGFFVSVLGGPLLWVTRQRSSYSDSPIPNLEPPVQGTTDCHAKQLSLLLQEPAEHLLHSSKAGAISALLLSHYGQDGGTIVANIEDVCTVFPSYFLTEEQKRSVTQAVEECNVALTNTESNTVEATATVEITDLYPSPPEAHSRSGWNQLYVARDAAGLKHIEFDGVFWWMDSTLISSDQEWCLT